MATEQLIAKRYRVIAKKGEGALSIVYRAHDTVLDRDVALKVLKSGPGLDRHAAERFDAEARAAARVVHPHVAAIYDVIECELGRAIVMEFIDGPSLAERLKVCGSLQEATTIGYARQIAQALAAAHALGLIHRDVKPGNALLTPGDEVKVVDFGLVKALDGTSATLTQSGMFVGSVHYVSPEQAQGKALSPASDLYSLGIIIYQMRTGHVPFGGEAPVAIALAHITNAVPSRRALEAAMSPGLATIVARLLQKDPARRYASAAEVVAALDDLSGQPAQTPAVAPVALDAPTVTTPIPVVPPRRPLIPAAAISAAAVSAVLPRLREVNVRRAAILAGSAILLLLFLIFAAPASAIVADVNGRSIAAARGMLAQSGLRTAVRTQPSEIVSPGVVMNERPGAGARLRPGATVQLVASSGPPFVTVPAMHGLPVNDARRELQQLKLQPRLGAQYSAAPQYTVIDQAPSAGTRVREGTGIVVVFAVQPQPVYPIYEDAGPPRGHGRGKHHKD